MAVLVTGGAGYIGSNTVVELIKSGEQVVVVDNFANSSVDVVMNIKKIVRSNFSFYEIDCCDETSLRKIFRKHAIESVIHFAGLKAVGESVKVPVKYYHENVGSVLALLKVMTEFGCFRLIFSSSATVYGSKNKAPFNETMIVESTNPYGETKIVVEKILRDCSRANSDLSFVSLRYFNPIGAHKSGLLGDRPRMQKPNNLMPYIIKVASEKLDCLKIFGSDYDTYDGTGIRDYIHVSDLSRGHVDALKFCRGFSGFEVFNLGTGKGISVLDVVKTFENVTGKKISWRFDERRLGDVAVCYCDPTKAQQMLGFEANLGLDKMCLDAWNCEQFN